MRPGWKDWLLFVVSLLLSAGGAFMLVTRRDLQSLTVAVFFGFVLAGAVGSLRQKQGMARSLARGDASLPGGVVHRARRGRLGVISAGFFVIGALFYAARESFAEGAGLVGVVSMLFGGAGLVALAVRKRTSVALAPEGVRLGLSAVDVTLPWSQIAQVDAGEWASNPAVFIHLRDAESLVADLRQRDPAAAARVAKVVASNRGWCECDILLMPWTYGLDAVVLAQAMVRYAEDPDARAELAPT